MKRARACTSEIRRGRLAKSGQFIDAADLIHDLAPGNAEVADVYVSLCVLAGIAAADVICCARLGVHAQGEDHHEAVSLLADAHADSSRHLRVLLGMKSKAGYSHSRRPLTTASEPVELLVVWWRRRGASMRQPRDAGGVHRHFI